jgi:predicted nucleic acid-binding Zn ribbon protein
MRRSAPRPLSLALDGVVATAAPQTALARVQGAWRSAVGDAIAAEAQPASMRAATVTIACRSAVWAQELDLMAPQLVAALNEALGEPLVGAFRCVATPLRITP